ncbi:MAG: hypothetical protein JWQ09_4198 [Segetibacter sp.]|nr:hypothetical protein [Segetibacter sp.]
MKHFIFLLFLFFIKAASGQSYYEVNYTNRDKAHPIKLTVGADEFRYETMAGTILKAKADSNIFFFITNRKETNHTVLGSVTECKGILPEPCSEEQLWKNDTVYYEKDILINGLLCKKVSINCIQSYMNEQNTIVPHDTIWHTYYVAPQIQTITPMSFSTGKVSGLVVKHVEERIQYSVVKGSIKKSLLRNEILSTVKKNVIVAGTYFKVPRGSYFNKTIDDLWEHLGLR